MDPLTMAALGYGANALWKTFGPQQSSGLEDPRKYRSQLMPNIGAMRGQAMRNATDANMAGLSNIRRAGAAGHLPSGAVLDATAGQAYQTARGVSSIEPQLGEIKRQAEGQYLDRLNEYGAAEAGIKNQQAAGISGDIGQLTKVAMLWQAGYFDQPGGGQQQFSGWDGRTDPRVNYGDPRVKQLLGAYE